jgi:hypothetical protein
MSARPEKGQVPSSAGSGRSADNTQVDQWGRKDQPKGRDVRTRRVASEVLVKGPSLLLEPEGSETFNSVGSTFRSGVGIKVDN